MHSRLIVFIRCVLCASIIALILFGLFSSAETTADSKTLLSNGSITGSMVRGGTPPGSYSTTFEITQGNTLEWSLVAPTGTRAACSVYIYSPSGEQLTAVKTDHTGTVYSLGITSYGNYNLTIVAPPSFTMDDVHQVIEFTFTYSIYQVVVSTPPVNTANPTTISPIVPPSSTPPPSVLPSSSDVGLMVFLVVLGIIVGSISIFVLKSASGKRLPRWGKVLLVLAAIAGVVLFIVGVLVFITEFLWVIALGFLFWFFIWICALGIGRQQRRAHYYQEPRDRIIIINGEPRKPRSDIQRGLDWHVPKVNKDGAEFITGSSSLRKQQKDAMRKTKKRFWG